jgi:hypothetical protein
LSHFKSCFRVTCEENAAETQYEANGNVFVALALPLVRSLVTLTPSPRRHDSVIEKWKNEVMSAIISDGSFCEKELSRETVVVQFTCNRSDNQKGDFSQFKWRWEICDEMARKLCQRPSHIEK